MHRKVSRPFWTAAEDWLGTAPERLEERGGHEELMRRWLWSFGPGTEADLVWWLGGTKGAVRQALADVGAAEVRLADGSAGWLHPKDGAEVAAPEPWALLLPALDPTTMGWKGRGFYLGDLASRLFDTNGNGGPTAWWDGHVVGGWTQEPDGTVVVVPPARSPRRPAARSRPRRSASPRGSTGRSCGRPMSHRLRGPTASGGSLSQPGTRSLHPRSGRPGRCKRGPAGGLDVADDRARLLQEREQAPVTGSAEGGLELSLEGLSQLMPLAVGSRARGGDVKGHTAAAVGQAALD